MFADMFYEEHWLRRSSM